MTVHVPTEFEVELVSGRYLDVTRPDHRMITLDDIATPLAKQCRYGGACAGFYSVAEHAVLVSRKLRALGASLSLQFAGLHHDDAEAFLSDIQRPVKLARRGILGNELADPDSRLTTIIDRAVWRALGWPDGSRDRDPLWLTSELHHRLVKRVDVWACAVEAARIMPSRGQHWEQTWLQAEAPMGDELADTIRCLEWPQARAEYLRQHYTLVAEARA